VFKGQYNEFIFNPSPHLTKAQPDCWIKMTILLCMRKLFSRSKFSRSKPQLWEAQKGTLI